MNHSTLWRFVLAVSLALNLGVGVALILRPAAPMAGWLLWVPSACG